MLHLEIENEFLDFIRIERESLKQAISVNQKTHESQKIGLRDQAMERFFFKELLIDFGYAPRENVFKRVDDVKGIQAEPIMERTSVVNPFKHVKSRVDETKRLKETAVPMQVPTRKQTPSNWRNGRKTIVQPFSLTRPKPKPNNEIDDSAADPKSAKKKLTTKQCQLALKTMELSKQKQIQQIENESKAFLSTEHTFKPKINKNVPNFRKIHRLQRTENLKSNVQVPIERKQRSKNTRKHLKERPIKLTRSFVLKTDCVKRKIKEMEVVRKQKLKEEEILQTAKEAAEKRFVSFKKRISKKPSDEKNANVNSPRIIQKQQKETFSQTEKRPIIKPKLDLHTFYRLVRSVGLDPKEF